MSALKDAEKTRLCIVSPTHWKAFMGGAQYQIKCILEALIPLHRYDISYIAHRVDPDFRADDYRIVPIGDAGQSPRFGYLMHALPLYLALKKIRPHVIYQRVGCGYTGVAAYYARRHGARLIWHIAHDGDVMRESLIDGRNPFRRQFEKRSVEYAIRHAQHIVSQTEKQASLLQSNFGRRVDIVIPNFHPEPEEVIDKAGPITVVWVANLKPWKQPDVFVRLARALRDLRDVRFVMVGAQAAAPSERRWSEALVKSIEGTPNLTFLGERSQADVNQLLATSHIFVNTSLHEGFANTFIQAWMREVPVVSLCVNPDGVFDRERVGFYAGSEDKLIEVVRRLVVEPLHRMEYASSARSYALEHHSFRNALLLAQLIDTGRVESQTTMSLGQSEVVP